MKPEMPNPNITPENQQSSVGYEKMYDKGINKTETLDSDIEKNINSIDKINPMIDNAFATTLPSPVVPNDDAQIDDSFNGNPLTASDDDLIEKEWVDKAKKIVSQTKDNPYERDKYVNKLQADYVKKRYGKELGVVD